MTSIERRAALGLLAAGAAVRPGSARAQATAAPVRIGVISDMSGPVRENGGPGSRLAIDLAVADFGGTVLGRPIQVMQADGQNKPDVSSALAREWIDNQGVSVLADGATSAAALAIQQVARDRKRVYLISSPASTALVGAQCSPYGFQFVGNTYAYTKAVSDTITRQGGDSWFIIAWDYEVGYALQASMEEFVRAAGGRIAGAVRAPINTADYSSYLVQAQASGAKVIGLCIAGSDLQNCVKQAAEFGITARGQLLATPILGEPDIAAIGQDACHGLMLSASFFWTLTPETRAWSERFMARAGKPPTQYHASAYSAALHWLKSVQAAGTLDADKVADTMRAMPVSDFQMKDVRFQPNQSLPLNFYLFEVKRTADSSSKWDLYQLRGSLPSPQAYPPPGLFGCPLARS